MFLICVSEKPLETLFALTVAQSDIGNARQAFCVLLNAVSMSRPFTVSLISLVHRSRDENYPV